MDKLIPLQPLEEMTEHWVKVGLLDPSWLHFVERYIMGINNIDILKNDDDEETELEKAVRAYPKHSKEAALANYRAGHEVYDTNGDLW